MTAVLRSATCPHCHEGFTLGVNGTVNGCDQCLGILRNPIDNTIIDQHADRTCTECKRDDVPVKDAFDYEFIAALKLPHTREYLLCAACAKLVHQDLTGEQS